MNNYDILDFSNSSSRIKVVEDLVSFVNLHKLRRIVIHFLRSNGRK